MINEATELLSIFVRVEQDKLNKQSMPHMPTLGKAYEEITKQGINQNFAIPKGLQLNVVSGFIRVGDELIPNQIDCMLIRDEAERYGITDEYICDIENVLAIFEVKKNLSKDDFTDAYEHLAVLRKKYSEYFSKKMDAMEERPNIDVASEIFSKLTGIAGPQCYDDIYSLPEQHQVLFYSLVVEQLAPVTIIHGYGGYKTEKGLRDVFVNYLDEENYLKQLTEKKRAQEEKKGDSVTMIRGMNSLPTLIISNEFSLVKINGLPYSFSMHNNKDDWVVIASCRDNPLRIMLELIWSKISVFCGANMPWGDDDQAENLAPLIFAKVVRKDEHLGWHYRSFELSAKKLRSLVPIKYEPFRISKAAIYIVQRLSFKSDGYAINDENRLLCKQAGYELDEIVEELISTTYFAINQNSLFTIHRTTYVLDFDEYGVVDSQFPRLKLWCDKNKLKLGMVYCITLS